MQIPNREKVRWILRWFGYLVLNNFIVINTVQHCSPMEVDFFYLRFEVKSVNFLCKVTFEKCFFVRPDFDQKADGAVANVG